MPRTLGLAAVLVPLALLSALPASGLAPTASDPCGEVLDDPAMGPVCVVPGGYLLLLEDGSRVFTHGPDPIVPARLDAGTPRSTADVACVDVSEPHVRVLYALPGDAHPVNLATGLASRRETIVAGILQANAIVDQSAAKFGTGMRWKMLCDEKGLPAIEPVLLSAPASSTSFGTIYSDVVGRGYTNANEKVLIFYDWIVSCGGCGGQSTIPGGDERGPNNANNYGQYSVSIVYIRNYDVQPVFALDEVILHEETHAMGGVQSSSPNSSGHGHCNDGWDIMCYADGGSRSYYGTYCSRVGHTYLGASQPYDCGNDDYFHPFPAPGSYLDTHWNVGAEYNRFMQRVPPAV